MIMYEISEAFHKQYADMYDKFVRIYLKDGSMRIGLFNDEFYEDISILVSCEVIKITDIEKMELTKETVFLKSKILQLNQNIRERVTVKHSLTLLLRHTKENIPHYKLAQGIVRRQSLFMRSVDLFVRIALKTSSRIIMTIQYMKQVLN